MGRAGRLTAALLAALGAVACGGSVVDRSISGGAGGRSASGGVEGQPHSVLYEPPPGLGGGGAVSGGGGAVSGDAGATGTTVPGSSYTVPPAVLDPGSNAPPPTTQPDDTEVALGPDARPSAYPDAASWRDTAPPDPTKPCCVVSGPAYVEPATNPASPVTAWGSDGWGVAWVADDGSDVFHALEPDGRGAGAPVKVVANAWNTDPALAWGNGRFALATIVSGNQPGLVVLTPLGYAPWGPVLAPVTGMDLYHAAVSRLTTAQGWVVAVNGIDNDGIGSAHVRAYLADDHGNFADPGGKAVANDAVTRPALANLKSNVALAWGDSTGIEVGLLDSTLSDPRNTVTAVLPFPGREDTRIALAPFRDSVVVVAVNPPDVYSAVFNPWDGTEQGPTQVGSSELLDYGAALAPAEERGFVGMCYSRGDQGHQSVLFRVLGPDGNPWTAEQTVADGLVSAAKCDVAWNGKEFLVVWWSAGTNDNTISVVRLQPTF